MYERSAIVLERYFDKLFGFYKENNKEVYVKPKVNFAIAAYYKGTALEEVIKRLEEYLDEAKNEENSINFL